jgi:phytanoyl-CoA hydroxylase
MLTQDQRAGWRDQGFFVIKAFATPAACQAMIDEAVAEIRGDPPAAHPDVPAYQTASGRLVQKEGKQPRDAVNPEDFVAKVFNTHLDGLARDFAVAPAAAGIVSELLDADVDVFQSMFILKNKGAWGQPWHQDSYYFNFDQQPQIGLWLSLTHSTRENGCLSVLPGSHKRPIETHVPDKREGANQGYLEVLGIDNEAAIEVIMEPGDLLVFHSYLLHKSFDHVGGSPRAAMVYHYGRTGTRNLADAATRAVQERVTHWIPAFRRAAVSSQPELAAAPAE